MKSQGDGGESMVVGLDFGARYTKALFRSSDPNDRIPRLLRFSERASDGEDLPFAAFSAIAFSNGTVTFGTEAMRKPANQRHDLLKLGIVDTERFRRRATASGPPVEVMAALFLAWALGRVRRSLEAEHPGASFVVNVAAPMDHRGDVRIKQRYRRILHAAWTMAMDAEEPEIGDAVSQYTAVGRAERLLSEHPQDDGIARWRIVPETIPPIVSILRTPGSRSQCEGIFINVDMGAATTQVSINRLNDAYPHATPSGRVICLADESHRLGCDEFSGSYEAEKAAKLAKLLAEVHRGSLERQETELGRMAWDHRRLVVFTTGGGCRRSDVRFSLQERFAQWGRSESEAGHSADEGRALRFLNHEPVVHGLVSEKELALRSFLTVAHGLCWDRWEVWPTFVESSQADAEPTNEQAASNAAPIPPNTPWIGSHH